MGGLITQATIAVSMEGTSYLPSPTKTRKGEPVGSGHQRCPLSLDSVISRALRFPQV